MAYGLRIRDADGNTVKITPIVGSIVAAGIYNSPVALNPDDTYGFNIDLPGTEDIPFANLAVIAIPRQWGWGMTVYTIGFGDPAVYTVNFYAKAANTYYVMAGDGSMSVWTAGNLTSDDPNTWDGLLTVWAVTEWMTEADDLYKTIRIFPAAINLIYDYSASAGVIAYNLYGVPSITLGVANTMVVVILKEWDF